jgi:hypothetical protein
MVAVILDVYQFADQAETVWFTSLLTKQKLVVYQFADKAETDWFQAV